MKSCEFSHLLTMALVLFRSPVRLTKVRPRHAPSAMLDEEDVALSAIKRFCRRAVEG